MYISEDLEMLYPVEYKESTEFMGHPIIDHIEGDPVVKIDGEKFRVMWKNKFPPEPALVKL